MIRSRVSLISLVATQRTPDRPSGHTRPQAWRPDRAWRARRAAWNTPRSAMELVISRSRSPRQDRSPFNHVPYPRRGAGIDGSRARLVRSSMALQGTPDLRAGRARETRSSPPAAPELPAFPPRSRKASPISSWSGDGPVRPAGKPAAGVERLNSAARAALTDPAVGRDWRPRASPPRPVARPDRGIHRGETRAGAR